MQSYLFIGGSHDGLNYPVTDDVDAVQLPKAGAVHYAYIRDTLAVGDVFITFYRHESLTPEQALDRIIEHYKAWAANRPGGRR